MEGSEPVEIRRYPNRRFYDRSRTRYVTMPEIEEVIQQGRDVVIVEAHGEEEITAPILVQILLERHPAAIDCLPVEMLHDLLRGDQAALGWWRERLGRAVEERKQELAEAGGGDELGERLARLEERVRRLEANGSPGRREGGEGKDG
jgi:polyhydroxyalkanoate synthesis repressor PhaR